MSSSKTAGNGGFGIEGETFLGGDGKMGNVGERGGKAGIGGEKIMLFHYEGIDELGYAGHPTLMTSEGL